MIANNLPNSSKGEFNKWISYYILVMTVLNKKRIYNQIVLCSSLLFWDN